MNVPDLTRIVEAHVPLSGPMLEQVRRDVSPHIRNLQRAGRLRWFCFLLHPAGHLSGHDSKEAAFVIQLRMEPSEPLSLEDFMADLPAAFKGPRRVPLGEIGGLDLAVLKNQDWAHGWRMVGEASEWVLSLLDSCEGDPDLEVAVQCLHYITNGLGIGGSCIVLPSGPRF